MAKESCRQCGGNGRLANKVDPACGGSGEQAPDAVAAPQSQPVQEGFATAPPKPKKGKKAK